MPRLRGNTGLFRHFHEGLARYRAVLSLPGAAGFFAAAAVARLGVAMTILGVLWAVRGATGSFASAGVATAGFALADAPAGPEGARLGGRRDGGGRAGRRHGRPAGGATGGGSRPTARAALVGRRLRSRRRRAD